MKAIVTVGISCSGKSVLASELKQQGWIDINRDDIRFNTFCSGVRDWRLYHFSSGREKMVTEIEQQMLLKAVAEKKNVIVSNTNLNKHLREKLVKNLTDLGYEVEVRAMPVEYDEAIRRDIFRSNGVGESVIQRQWQQWNKFIGRRVYTPPSIGCEAIIFDIDGTLADHDGIRGHFEWDKVDLDRPVPHIIDMANGYAAEGIEYKIICVSGRDGSCREKTEQWLEEYRVPYDELFMRAAGDNRKDWVVKEEIFWDNIADKYRVSAVVDDRPQVLRMWRDIGLNTICVGNPWINF